MPDIIRKVNTYAEGMTCGHEVFNMLRLEDSGTLWPDELWRCDTAGCGVTFKISTYDEAARCGFASEIDDDD